MRKEHIYLDISYDVHYDRKGNVEIFATEGNSTLMLVLTKCKLNTSRSSGIEIVVVSEKLLKQVWLRYFCIDHGSCGNEDVLYQDNKSTALLVDNGIYLARKGSTHIYV